MFIKKLIRGTFLVGLMLPMSAIALSGPHGGVPLEAGASTGENKTPPSQFTLEQGQVFAKSGAVELVWDMASRTAYVSHDGETCEVNMKPVSLAEHPGLLGLSISVENDGSAEAEATMASSPCQGDLNRFMSYMNHFPVACEDPATNYCADHRRRMSAALAAYVACMMRVFEQER